LAKHVHGIYSCRNPKVNRLVKTCKTYIADLRNFVVKTYGDANVIYVEANVETRLSVHAKNPYMPLKIGLA